MGLVSWLNRTFRTEESSAPPAEIADGAEDVSVMYPIAENPSASEEVAEVSPSSESVPEEEKSAAEAEAYSRLVASMRHVTAAYGGRSSLDSDGPNESGLWMQESGHRSWLAEQAPIARLAMAILQQAIEQRASHIHFEPGVRSLRIRYRIDGVLYEATQLPKYLEIPLINRYKVLAEIDRATHRGLPQEGRFPIRFNNIDFNVCVHSHPARYGDCLTLYLHSSPRIRSGYDALGISTAIQKELDWLLYRPCGLLLVVGPSGSGSTTTQYSLLNHLNTVGVHIVTVEERVTYSLDGLSQFVPNTACGETQSSAIRAALRQDADVMGIGDLKNKKTMLAALEAAANSLVIATMHGNEALSSMVRLASLGIDPGLIASNVQGVITQRRVRRICPHCKELYEVAGRELRRFGFDPEDPEAAVTLARGTGCDACYHTGYLDCIGLYELFEWNGTLLNMFTEREALPRLKQAFAWSHRSDALKDDGLKKILAHVTTPEEVYRVL